MKPNKWSYTRFMLKIYGSAVTVFPFTTFYYEEVDVPFKMLPTSEHPRSIKEDGFTTTLSSN